jgi:hypothetical protein
LPFVLLRCGPLEVLGELIELGFPEPAVVLDPRGGVAHRARDERRAPYAPLTPYAREPGTLEDAHVLGRGRQRHVEMRRELADRLVAGRQPAEDLAPHRVRERAEGHVEPGRMVNHVV